MYRCSYSLNCYFNTQLYMLSSHFHILFIKFTQLMLFCSSFIIIQNIHPGYHDHPISFLLVHISPWVILLSRFFHYLYLHWSPFYIIWICLYIVWNPREGSDLIKQSTSGLLRVKTFNYLSTSVSLLLYFRLFICLIWCSL